MRLAWIVGLVVAVLAGEAAAQGFGGGMGPFGWARRLSGESFQSAADPAKDATVGLEGKGFSFAIGGQFFARTETRTNKDFDDKKDDLLTFTDQRARISTRTSIGGRLGFVLEFQDVRHWGVEPSTSTLAPLTGLHQGFADIRVAPWFDVRVGRQELAYGEERLIGALDWAMAARIFDGAFGRFSFKDWTVDLFGMVVRERQTLVDPADPTKKTPNDGAQFYGVYSRFRPSKKVGLDVYALGYVNDTATLASGPRGDRGFGTFGGRAFVDWKGLKAVGEGAYQYGTSAEVSNNKVADHRAWAFAAKLSYEFPVWGKPYLGFEYSMASGDDDPNDGVNHQFNQLFPTAHAHLGYMDYVAWQNARDVHYFAGWRPWGTHMWFDVHKLSMVKANGVWSDATGATFVNADPLRASTDMGTELDWQWVIPFHKSFSVMLAWNAFVPGAAALKPTGSTVTALRSGSDISHWAYVYLRSQF